ncbi:hypothetical protein APA_2727 [Pseudanabaena sp. lw0831]|nr:hypothetical protein APA_2727 [Pseudanabaena sp. lw0831]
MCDLLGDAPLNWSDRLAVFSHQKCQSKTLHSLSKKHCQSFHLQAVLTWMFCSLTG